MCVCVCVCVCFCVCACMCVWGGGGGGVSNKATQKSNLAERLTLHGEGGGGGGVGREEGAGVKQSDTKEQLGRASYVTR